MPLRTQLRFESTLLTMLVLAGLEPLDVCVGVVDYAQYLPPNDFRHAKCCAYVIMPSKNFCSDTSATFSLSSIAIRCSLAFFLVITTLVYHSCRILCHSIDLKIEAKYQLLDKVIH